mgnify:CR=1 FL=1
MTKWNEVDEVLDFAIANEEEAARFYYDLSSRAENKWMRKVFEDYAKEEMRHKDKLMSVKKGKILLGSSKKVLDLKMSDYLVDVEATGDLDYQDAIILAMKKEKAAFRLYHDLSEAAEDEQVRELFAGLAQEEAKHKLRFELEYDDKFLQDN